ncbi:MAG: UvrD-helicase domain-containing protein [Salinivirgaceae bacterium]|nr:UvrD-helicase domain-containing protein [Salinivirgaceae bacterium]
MKLTEEQQQIIASEGDIRINAVAGSGKTTTVVAYAKARPRQSRILYLAFNRSVKIEAVQKFYRAGLPNVKVETAHSLAFRRVVAGSNYKVRSQGYKTHELVDLLKIYVSGEKHAEYIVAGHVNKFAAYFCNSDKAKVHELNYLDVVFDRKATGFVRSYYKIIEKFTRIFLAKMDRAEVEITHDFYLKKFQLQNPVLTYDYILFDEGQDASGAMLDVFLRQNAVKVIVGDSHQQIYGWRYAVNSLEKVNFQHYNLSRSFRFGEGVALLACQTVAMKKLTNSPGAIQLTGVGNSETTNSKAVLARTNLGLLMRAIEQVTESGDTEKIYFEGNINSYTYADDGASLYDVLNLYNGKRRLIRDKMIRQMRNLDDLVEYIESTEDKQLGMMVEIVKKYGNQIPGIIKKIKGRHVDGDDKTAARMIYSTVHRCKGMEYDEVFLVDDFVTKEKLEKLAVQHQREKLDLTRLNEEVNLLYVAVTRAKTCIHIPETLLPENFPVFNSINVIKVETDEDLEDEPSSVPSSGSVAPKNSEYEEQMARIKAGHKKAYQPWTEDLDLQLTRMYCEGEKIKAMSEYFGRTPGAIRSRIKKLELPYLYNE